MDDADAGDAFAEKLGLWVHFADAIALSAIHGEAAPGPRETLSSTRAGARAAAAAELSRARALLTDSIMKSCSPNPGRSHIKLPAPETALPLELAAAYAPYRRFYAAHQRDMELSIQPLRVNLREALAQASPRHRQLAELDSVLEKVLRERESKLLSKVPVLLGRRFGQLYKDHQQTLADAGQADDPTAWPRAGGWLARFCDEMQKLLLSELELRLQPSMGLAEAINQDTQ